MRTIRNTFFDQPTPILVIQSETGFAGSPIIAVDRYANVVIRRYGPNAVSLIREYLRAEWPGYDIRG